MRKTILILFLLFFSFSQKVLASSARSVVETQVESSGESQIYQSVETTVDGETVKKESNQPGKLELEMKKIGEGQPTVTFSQESATITPTPLGKSENVFLATLFLPIVEFIRNLFAGLTSWLK